MNYIWATVAALLLIQQRRQRDASRLPGMSSFVVVGF